MGIISRPKKQKINGKEKKSATLHSHDQQKNSVANVTNEGTQEKVSAQPHA